MFLKSRGPLRFDQWLELSLDNPPSPPAEGGTAKLWRRVLRPPTVSAFAAREPRLAEELGRALQRSALARRTGFRLEATGAVLDGKALGGFDQGSLPLWWARDKAAASVADGVRGILAASHLTRIGTRVCGEERLQEFRTNRPCCAEQLHNGLLAALDARLGEATQEDVRSLRGDSRRGPSTREGPGAAVRTGPICGTGGSRTIRQQLPLCHDRPDGHPHRWGTSKARQRRVEDCCERNAARSDGWSRWADRSGGR